MIEKLDKHLAKNINSCNMSQNIMVAHKAIEKINELCDAVNTILSRTYTVPIEDIANVPQENKFDPYAEQRKWIGKLCKFWFADAEHPTFGILDFVDAGLHPEPFHTDCGESEQGWYPHCEPVKADSDIIYKGNDNEK